MKASDNAAFRYLLDKAQALDAELAKVEAKKKTIEADLRDVTAALEALLSWSPKDAATVAEELLGDARD